jgi:tetratricopeptide (TPR) repeat protein
VPKQRRSANGLQSLVIVCLCLTLFANRVMGSSKPRLQPAASDNVIAVIDSMVVNGLKSDTATAADIELTRAGAVTPESTVGVGNELRPGDKIRTKDDDQLVLRVPNSETGTDDVVFLDPNSEIGIGSVCALAGRVLSWAGLRFRLCTSWGTLGVEGTEFEVNISPSGELTVLVYEGKVKLDPEVKTEVALVSKAEVVPATRPQAETNDILPGAALKLKPDGTTERLEVTLATKLENVDYWSNQIIKATKPTAGVTKGFVNYSGDSQVEEFKKARREALVDNRSSAYLTLGKVLNDWNDGAAAQKSLVKVKDENLLKSADYMVNVAEADRLQGRLAAADAQLDKTVAEHPEYAAAYYLKAKVGEQKIAIDPALKATEAAKIRKNLSQSLALYSGESHLKTTVVEADLNKTIAASGTESLNNNPWLSAGNEFFKSAQTGVTTVAGYASINVENKTAKGAAELYIVGDQFKLEIANQLFTGRIVGNRNAAGTSFAMQFDNVGTVGGAVLSVTGTRQGRGFTLHAEQQPAGTFTFTTKGALPR